MENIVIVATVATCKMVEVVNEDGTIDMVAVIDD